MCQKNVFESIDMFEKESKFNDFFFLHDVPLPRKKKTKETI